MVKVRCLECYKQRPGGRCQLCPLAKKNRHLYRPLEDGWFEFGDSVKKATKESHKDQKD